MTEQERRDRAAGFQVVRIMVYSIRELAMRQDVVFVPGLGPCDRGVWISAFNVRRAGTIPGWVFRVTSGRVLEIGEDDTRARCAKRRRDV
jgi:hypothetical protein